MITSAGLLPISEIAKTLGIADEYLEPYGRHTAKIRLEVLDRAPAARGKLILVTAMTPTRSGEGKTVNTIALTQGLRRIGRHAVAALREPSLGPVFGMKGGATGGGRSSVLPADRINLHFNGDFHALTASHNLLAALIDNHLHFGNPKQLDPAAILWPRTMDMNDRALRSIVVGLGGRANGPTRESRFVITAASEIMAILALASSREDLRVRLARIVVGFDTQGTPVTAGQLDAAGAMMALLNDAIMPNLVQTSEGAPALIHAGPFANIAHGTSSVLAQRIGLQFADYVVNETGFAADLGAEKFFDIVMPASGHVPSAAVVIVTIKGLRAQGEGLGASDPLQALEAGFENVEAHLRSVQRFGVPAVVALNRFPSDIDEETDRVLGWCRERGIAAAISDGFARGGDGARELAELTAAAADGADPSKVHSLYDAAALTLPQKIEAIARTVYGASAVTYEPAAQKRLERYAALGYGRLPVCMAKTQYSITDNPSMAGAPTDWVLTVRDAVLAAGAGFVVVPLGEMQLMPGLAKSPQATRIDVTADGEITGVS